MRYSLEAFMTKSLNLNPDNIHRASEHFTTLDHFLARKYQVPYQIH